MPRVLMSFALLAVGFVFLAKGADWMIEGSSALARHFRISEMVIGLTIVAFGTSAPELVVNIVSSVRGASELVIGNIIGSNIANITLVIGAAGLFAPLAVKKNLVRKEILFGFIGAVAVYLLAISFNSGGLTLSRMSGGILLAGFGAFLYFIYRAIRSGEHFDALAKPSPHKTLAVVGLIIGGLAGLTFGGKLVVDSALEIAVHFGISEGLIGLSLIALGTSLPELVTSVTAVLKNKIDLAIGSAVGSNIFNIFWVLGLSAVIRPIAFAEKFLTDLLVLGGITLLLILLIFITPRWRLTRVQSAVLLTSYAGYLGFLFQRG